MASINHTIPLTAMWACSLLSGRQQIFWRCILNVQIDFSNVIGQTIDSVATQRSKVHQSKMNNWQVMVDFWWRKYSCFTFPWRFLLTPSYSLFFPRDFSSSSLAFFLSMCYCLCTSREHKWKHLTDAQKETNGDIDI